MTSPIRRETVAARPVPRAARTLVAAAAAALGAWPSAAQAQDLTRRAAPQDRPVAIVNATVHTMDGPAIEAAGWVLFDRGVIVEVGGGRPSFPPDRVRVIDASGMHVYPGLISAATQMGLTEIQSVRATNDMTETGAVKPEVLAALSVNPDSTLLPVTRANGVLVCGVMPTGGSIPGRASVIRLEGWTWEDMAVERDAGVVVAWPVMRPVRAGWMDRSEEEQSRDIRRNVEVIESAFRECEAYVAARAADPSVPADIRWEALAGVLPPARRGESGGAGTADGARQRPVFIEATDYDQIVAAVSFAARRGLKAVIVGGRDAPLCADLLRRHGVGVIVPGTFRLPRRDDSPYDEAYTLPARLEAAGVPWCLAGGDDTAHERNLPYAAALAVAHGLDHDAALRAITRSAAELLGVADRLGTLAPGKEATLFIADGDVLEVTTNVRRAFIAGREIDLSNKQTELEHKYRARYRAPAEAGGGAGGPAAPTAR